MIYTALFAALICAGCFIQIPFPAGVPVVIQDMAAVLSGMLLGPIYGTAAVAIFLFLGILGLPVFSGKGGLYVLIGGPTCGFLLGYLAAALAAGLIMKLVSEDKNTGIRNRAVTVTAATTANLILFIIGTAGFAHVTESSFSLAAAAVVLPFIPGNIIKIIITVALTLKFRNRIKEYLKR